MDKKYKDTDLREALKRKYADTPQLPDDFMANMESLLQPRLAFKNRKLWRWMAAAACVLLIIGIGMTIVSIEDASLEAPKVVAKAEPTPVSVSAEPEVTPLEKIAVKQNREKHGTPKDVFRKKQKRVPVILVEAEEDPNLHYAAIEATKDTVPYQDPVRVDQFIAKLAGYYHVKQGELLCSAPLDSNMVSAVYVFPDKKEIDVFSRLLQVACCYSDDTPGYFLNFSHQQFFFELKDMRKQLHYRWIAERVNGMILLYGTNAPIGAKTSSACYQDYRDQLMHTKIINTKTRAL